MTETTLAETTVGRGAEKTQNHHSTKPHKNLVQQQVQNTLELFDAHVLCVVNSTLKIPQAHTEACHH